MAVSESGEAPGAERPHDAHVLAVTHLRRDQEEHHHPPLARVDDVARVAQCRGLQQGMAARWSERLTEVLEVSSTAGVRAAVVESDNGGDERAVAVDLLVRQPRRRVVLDHERAVDEQLSRVADRLLAEALASQRSDTWQAVSIEPA